MKARIRKTRNEEWLVVHAKDFKARLVYFDTWQDAIDWVMSPQKHYWHAVRTVR